MNKIHFIFSQVYFNSSILTGNPENTKISTLLTPFQNDPEIVYLNNYFIQNFGKLELIKSVSFFPVYGSKGNFSFYIKSDNYYVKIIPIIHFNGFGIINIILAGTYITNDSKLNKQHPKSVGKLRRSFEYGEPLFNLCNTKCSTYFNNLRDIVDYIKNFCVKKSYPSFDFNSSKCKKYYLFNLIKFHKQLDLLKVNAP